MKVEVRKARPDEVAAFYADRPTAYDLVKVGDDVVAMAAFIVEAGRTWAVLDVKELGRIPPILMVRGLRRVLMLRGGPVFCACDDKKFPRAPRMISAVGFQPTDEMRHDYGVWIWNCSPS